MDQETIYANNATYKGFISKIYKQFIQLNIKTNKQPNQKLGRRSKQVFLQRRQTDGQQSPEKMFDVSTYERTQIKTAKLYHLALVRMTTIKQYTNNKGLRGYGEKRTLLHCCWNCKLMHPLWRTVSRFFKKLKIEKCKSKPQ